MFDKILQDRQTHGYQYVCEELYNNILPENYRYFLGTLKRIFDIDDNTFEEILGMKELNTQILSPEGYDKEQIFILILHLLLINIFYPVNSDQSKFIKQIIQSYKYNNESLIFLQEKVHPLIQNSHFCFEDIDKIEKHMLNLFILKFNKLP